MKKTVTLAPGESKVAAFSFSPTSAGLYNVNVDGLTGSFVVVALPGGPEFVVSDLHITPAEVYIGETVTISVLVTNIGEAAGTYEVNCEVT